MKVQVVMTTDIGFCNMADNLTKAAEIMWQKNCGVVPIVDENLKVVGMITDRDICVATATRNQKPSDIAAREMINGEVICCAADDKIETALKKMKKNQFKRLPITDANGELIVFYQSLMFCRVDEKPKSCENKSVTSSLFFAQ